MSVPEDGPCALSHQNTRWETRLVGFWSIVQVFCAPQPPGLGALKPREKPPDGHVINKIVLAFSALDSIYGLRVTIKMHSVH